MDTDEQTTCDSVQSAGLGQIGDNPTAYELLDDTPVLVHSGLYIGTYRAEQNRRKLMQSRITDVLQVAEGLFPHFPLQFNYMNIQVQDVPSEDMVIHFPKCFEFIDNAIARGGSVLVHCAAGVSRSATVVLGYLMARRGMTATEACTYLRTKRPWVNPNNGFRAQLEAFQLLGCDTSKWRAWRHVWQEPLQAGVVVDVRSVLSVPSGGEGSAKAISTPPESPPARSYPCAAAVHHEVPHLPAAAAAAAAAAAERRAQQCGPLEPLAAAAAAGGGGAPGAAIVVGASRSRYGSADFAAAATTSSRGQEEAQSAPCCSSLAAAVAAEAFQREQQVYGSAACGGGPPLPWPSAASLPNLSSSSGARNSLSCPLPSSHLHGHLPSAGHTAPLEAGHGARLQSTAHAQPQQQQQLGQDGQQLSPRQLLPLLKQQALEGRLGQAPTQTMGVAPMENVMGLGI